MPLIAPPGATYGWRARVGLIQPGAVAENNPYEFYLMAPQGVTLVATPLGHTGLLNQAAFDQMLAGMDEAVERLLIREIDSIIQAGVPHIVTKGWGFEEKLRAQVGKLT